MEKLIENNGIWPFEEGYWRTVMLETAIVVSA
jgi:hypothetical protein